ncbi:MAG TPA: exodeoxyribonuclease VII small subunit [Leifsonia sp.]|jgi:exodeoxyribonuclease VII small subunit
MDAMPTTETTPAGDPLDSLSYEQARDELVRVVAELEQGSSTLEESIALWERGEALARHCEEWLIGAKARLDAARAGGTAGAVPGSTTGAGAADTE